jgi:hypothetical protein
VASIPTIEQTQRGLQNAARRPRAVCAVYEAVRDRATTSGRWSRGAPPRTSVGGPQDRTRGCVFTTAKPPDIRRLRLPPDPAMRAICYFQRCPASSTSAELASAEMITRTRKA